MTLNDLAHYNRGFYGFYICSQWAFIHALLSRVPFALAGLSCYFKHDSTLTEEIGVRFHAATHISRVNCAKIDGVYQAALHMKFSTLNVDFDSASFDPLGSRSPPNECIKFGYPQFGTIGATLP